MFTCGVCGRSYKFLTGLNNHKHKSQKCNNESELILGVNEKESVDVNGGVGGGAGGGAGGGYDDDDDDITKSTFFTFPLTQLKPTANFSKEDLEMLEKRKQDRLRAIQQSRYEEKQRAAASAAAASAAAAAAAAGKYKPVNNETIDLLHKGDCQTQDNVGNEEHNASINIKYVRTSSQTKQVIDAVSAAANEYCESQGLGVRSFMTSGKKTDASVDGGGGGVNTLPSSVSASGKTVYNHPPRTISIIENEGGDEEMDESERIVTLEKMTYLVLALIQQNTKIQKENALLKAIISNIDPSKLEFE